MFIDDRQVQCAQGVMCSGERVGCLVGNEARNRSKATA